MDKDGFNLRCVRVFSGCSPMSIPECVQSQRVFKSKSDSKAVDMSTRETILLPVFKKEHTTTFP